MRVDRERLKLFIRDLRITEVADEFQLTDSQLVEQIALYFENEPKAINFGTKKGKGFWESDEDKETHNYD